MPGITGPIMEVWEKQSAYTKLAIQIAIVLAGLLIVLGIFGFGFLAKYISMKSSGLDNRPRWMMGGLRDDTGSHNAKDVFGMGFGLDQTRVGTATADGMFNLKQGMATLPIGDKVQSEYKGYLGQ